MITSSGATKAGLYAGMLVALVAAFSGCQTGGQTEWGTGIGTATGAAAGYALAGDDSQLEGALIGAAVGGGTGYLVGSHLEKSEQRTIAQEYNRMMELDSKQRVNQSIDEMGDRVLGNADGHATAAERNQALTQLEYAMETAADKAGNRDGNCTIRERNEYVNRFGDHPLIQILSGRGG